MLIIKTLLCLATFLILFVSFSFASFYDSGYKTFIQPDGTKFVGREWGDEFLFRRMTEDGYVYLWDNGHEWAYYAILNEKGNYALSNARVGVDAPPSIKKLKRSKEYIKSRIERKDDFNKQLSLKLEETKKSNKNRSQTYDIGIVLVEFSDDKHHTYTNAVFPATDRPNGYYISDFENLFFSSGTYNTGSTGIYSPNGDIVFGSINDYYSEMSVGDVIISGEIVNYEDANHPGVPLWVELPYSKSYHENLGWYDPGDPPDGYWPGAAYVAAEEQIPDFDRDDYDVVAIIYAQDTKEGTTLHPTTTSGGKTYWCGETSTEAFTHIGDHCHELGHALFNFPDNYYDEEIYPENNEKPIPGSEDYFHHGLMAGGNSNGRPNRIGNAPAPVNPILRYQRGWVSVITVDYGQSLHISNFNDNNSNPVFYKILGSQYHRSDPWIGKYYLIENRQKTSPFDKYAPFLDDNEEGILVWERYAVGGYLTVDLIELDDNWDDIANHFPGNQNNMKVFLGDGDSNGGGGFVIHSKNGSLGNYSYDITFYGDGKIWSGTYNDKVYASGEFKVGDLTIKDEAYFMANTNLSFNSGGSISFQNGGYLITNGTSEYPIIFKGNNSTWDGILLSGSAASNTVLKYCEIRDIQTYGGSSLNITSCSPSISYSIISNNYNYGTNAVYVNNGNPDINYNTLNSNGQYGISYYNSSGNVYANEIINNNNGGIYCSSYSSPSFGKPGFNASSGNNVITDSYYGVIANYYSNPYIGSQYSTNYYGSNCIFNNSAYNIKATNYCSILAEKNWWNSTSNSQIRSKLYYNSGSYIDFYPYLYGDPFLERKNFYALENSLLENSGTDDIVKISIEYRINGDYISAKELLFQCITSKSTSSLDQINPLVELFNLYKASHDIEIRDFIQNLYCENYDVSAVRLLTLAQIDHFDNKLDDAIIQYKEICYKYPGTIHNEIALNNIFIIYFSIKNDLVASKMILNDINIKFSFNENTKSLNYIYNSFSEKDIRNAAEANNQNKNNSIITSPNIFELKQNYPNPFNNSTFIEFNLPKDIFTEISVFDVSGRLITTLLKQKMSKGYHSVHWQTDKISSGFYFIRLIAGSESTLKMFVIEIAFVKYYRFKAPFRSIMFIVKNDFKNSKPHRGEIFTNNV